MNTQSLTDAYIKAIDSYFVAVFIDLVHELGIGLDIADEKRNLIFKAVKEAGELKK